MTNTSHQGSNLTKKIQKMQKNPERDVIDSVESDYSNHHHLYILTKKYKISYQKMKIKRTLKNIKIIKNKIKNKKTKKLKNEMSPDTIVNSTTDIKKHTQIHTYNFKMPGIQPIIARIKKRRIMIRNVIIILILILTVNDYLTQKMSPRCCVNGRHVQSLKS